MDAGVAPGDRFPSGQHLFHNKAKRQRGDSQVDALHAQRRQAHHQAHGGRQSGSACQRNRKGHAHVGEHRVRVGAHPQKRRMPHGEQAGKACQQHQPQAGNRVNQYKGQLRQPVLGKQPGRGS